jgi:general secretion pathway protein A
LSRKLFQELRQRSDIDCHMMLDPSNESEQAFMESLVRAMGLAIKADSTKIVDFKEMIKDYLFKNAAKDGKTVVLVVDEAQKLNSSSLEVLRTLLNYETNDYKMLQLVLLGQNELIPTIKLMPNFLDRVSLKYCLGPLSEAEAGEMIDFRLKKAGYCFSEPLFTAEALKEIYKFTKGYPRRLGMACHCALKELVMKNKKFVDVEVIKGLLEADSEFAESIAGY